MKEILKNFSSQQKECFKITSEFKMHNLCKYKQTSTVITVKTEIKPESSVGIKIELKTGLFL